MAAIGLATSGYAIHYRAWLATSLPVQFGAFAETLDAAAWVRALLMPVFFLVLGMQLKFELLQRRAPSPCSGTGAIRRTLRCHCTTALGGLLGPAAIYLALALERTARAASGGLGHRRCRPWNGLLGAGRVHPADRPAPASLRVLLIAVALADNLVAVVLGALSRLGALDSFSRITGAER